MLRNFFGQICAAPSFTPYLTHFLGFASRDFQPMLPPTPGRKRRGGVEISAPLWVADFYMGPSNESACADPFCPSHMPCRPIHCQPTQTRNCTGQTTATSRIKWFPWQQPPMRLIAIATSAVQ